MLKFKQRYNLFRLHIAFLKIFFSKDIDAYKGFYKY